MLFYNGEMSVGEMMLYHIDFSTVGSMINGDSFCVKIGLKIVAFSLLSFSFQACCCFNNSTFFRFLKIVLIMVLDLSHTIIF